MKKRIVSMTLALLMVVSAISSTAMASATDDESGIMPLGLACMKPNCDGTIREHRVGTAEEETVSKPALPCGCVEKTTYYTALYERVCDRCGDRLSAVEKSWNREWVDNSNCRGVH